MYIYGSGIIGSIKPRLSRDRHVLLGLSSASIDADYPSVICQAVVVVVVAVVFRLFEAEDTI